MSFKFNIKDTESIQGLKRYGETNPPFLTPVFFDIDVLIKYLNNPKYTCEFVSETYGTIKCPDKSYFPFGINPNNKVVAWLGDLMELDAKEIKYLESENIDSDGNIESQFYHAQIEGDFTDPIREVDLIIVKKKLNELTNSLFQFDLYKSTFNDFDDVIGTCSKFKKLTFNSVDDFKGFISFWNEKLIEDLNTSDVKQFLKTRDVVIENNSKGLKLLEKLIKEVLKVEDNIIAPLYNLYDLRIWSTHSGTDSKYNTVLSNIELPNDAPFSDVYIKIIKNLYLFYVQLKTKLIDLEKIELEK